MCVDFVVAAAVRVRVRVDVAVDVVLCVRVLSVVFCVEVVEGKGRESIGQSFH